VGEEQHSSEMDFRWWLTATSLCIVLATPFFLVDVPPVLDYPDHLARLFVLTFGSGDPILSTIYAPHWTIVPNLGIDLVGPPLMRVLPVHVAGKLLLACAAFLPVIGVVCYHRAVFGRVSLWPLMSALVAFNGIFFLGFINFLWGVGLALIAAAAWIRLIDRHPLRAIAVSIPFGIVLFFCHILAVLFFGLLIGAREFVGVWRCVPDLRAALQRVATRAGMLALVLLPVGILYCRSAFAGAPVGLVWDEPSRKLIDLLSPFMTYSQPVAALTFVGVVGAIIIVWRHSARDPGTMMAAIILLAVYVVAPAQMKGGTFIDVRLPTMILLLVFAGLQPSVPGRIAAVGLLVAGVTLLLVRTATIAATWFDHRHDLAAFRATIAPLTPGARVLVVTAVPAATPERLASEPIGRLIPGLFRTDEHMAALMLIERRAFWPFLFADPRQQPIALRAPYAAIAHPLGEPQDFRDLADDKPATPGEGYLADWPTHFDYVLLLDAGATDAAAFLPNRLAVLTQSDFAALYQVRRP
jgi:hypothetical protein